MTEPTGDIVPSDTKRTVGQRAHKALHSLGGFLQRFGTKLQHKHPPEKHGPPAEPTEPPVGGMTT